MIPEFRELVDIRSLIEDFWQTESVVPHKSKTDILLQYDKLK